MFSYSRGVSLHERNAEGRTALHIAAASGCVEAILTLSQNGALVNVVDSQGYSPLHLASANGHDIVVRLLLDNLGADRDLITCGVAGSKTALQLAASDRVRRMLLEPGIGGGAVYTEVIECDIVPTGRSPFIRKYLSPY